MGDDLQVIDKLGDLNTNIAILNERIAVLNSKLDNGAFQSIHRCMNKVFIAVLGVLVPMIGFFILSLTGGP